MKAENRIFEDIIGTQGYFELFMLPYLFFQMLSDVCQARVNRNVDQAGNYSRTEIICVKDP